MNSANESKHQNEPTLLTFDQHLRNQLEKDNVDRTTMAFTEKIRKLLLRDTVA